MEFIIFIFLIIFISYFIFTKIKISNIFKDFNIKNNNAEYNEFNIFNKKSIFTKYELIFYNELKEIIKNTNYNLFSKVRIADLTEAKKNISYSDFIKIFNKINRKHIDFLITDNFWNILILIELDWYSHNYKKTIESDKIKEKLFSTLGIPFLRFKNWKNHNLEELKKLLYLQ